MCYLGKGFAYITYTLPENAVRACAGLDRQSFQGRLLHVTFSRLTKSLSHTHSFNALILKHTYIYIYEKNNNMIMWKILYVCTYIYIHMYIYLFV